MLYGKKLIIFDLDGTLIDSIGMWNWIDEVVLRELGGISIKNVQTYRDNYLRKYQDGDIYLEYCKHLREITGSSLSALEILKWRWTLADKYIKSKIDYKLGADKVLHLLKSCGFELAIGSSTSKVQMDVYLNDNQNIISKADFKDIFSVIMVKEDVFRKKPDPEVYLKIMEKMGREPSECLVIEDSLNGIEAAKRASIEVAWMYDRYSLGDSEEINRLSDYQLRDYEEFLKIIQSDVAVKKRRVKYK